MSCVDFYDECFYDKCLVFSNVTEYLSESGSWISFPLQVIDFFIFMTLFPFMTMPNVNTLPTSKEAENLFVAEQSKINPLWSAA